MLSSALLRATVTKAGDWRDSQNTASTVINWSVRWLAFLDICTCAIISSVEGELQCFLLDKKKELQDIFCLCFRRRPPRIRRSNSTRVLPPPVDPDRGDARRVTRTAPAQLVISHPSCSVLTTLLATLISF